MSSSEDASSCIRNFGIDQNLTLGFSELSPRLASRVRGRVIICGGGPPLGPRRAVPPSDSLKAAPATRRAVKSEGLHPCQYRCTRLDFLNLFIYIFLFRLALSSFLFSPALFPALVPSSSLPPSRSGLGSVQHRLLLPPSREGCLLCLPFSCEPN